VSGGLWMRPRSRYQMSSLSVLSLISLGDLLEVAGPQLTFYLTPLPLALICKTKGYRSIGCKFGVVNRIFWPALSLLLAVASVRP